MGLRDSQPAFGRFTYFEKFDYWAVFWGCVILVGTGLVMWFPHVAGILLPCITPDAFNAFKEAHAHEALLAVLAIFIWHFYNVHFRPGRLPGSLSWTHGRVRHREMAREHPLEINTDCSSTVMVPFLKLP